MHTRLQSSASALVCLILSFLLFGGATAPAHAFPWGPGALAVSPDGRRVYVTDPFHSGVAVIDTATNQLLSILYVGGASLAVSPDGTQLYGTAGDWLNIVSLATGKVRAAVMVGQQPGSVVASPDGRRVYVVAGGSSAVAVVDPAAGQVVATIKAGSDPRGMAIQPDGRRLYVASGPVDGLTGQVTVIDTTTNQVIATLNVHGDPDAVAVSPDGRRVYVTHPEASSAMDVIETATLGLVGNELVIPGGHSRALAVDPVGARLYIIASEFPIVGAIRVIEPGLLGVAPEKAPIALGVSPDGRRVYVANKSGTVSVLDALTLQVMARIDLIRQR